MSAMDSANPESVSVEQNGPWNDAKNARRFELIDKDVQNSLSESERRELELLTAEMRAHRRRVAPIPMAGATMLLEQLLRKQQEQEHRGIQ